jgi:hypothetical protein
LASHVSALCDGTVVWFFSITTFVVQSKDSQIRGLNSKVPTPNALSLPGTLDPLHGLVPKYSKFEEEGRNTNRGLKRIEINETE